MKSSRRGGLGRGLGALIQSTVEVEDTPSSAEPSTPAAPDKGAGTNTARAKRPTATPETAGAGTDPLFADADQPSSATTDSTAKTSASAGRRKSTAAASTATEEKSTSGASRRRGKASTGSPTPTSGQDDGSPAPKDGTPGRKDGSPSGAPTRGAEKSVARPSDIFFTPTAEHAEDAPAEESTAGRRSSRSGRPSMPTVKAPSKRSGASTSKATTPAPEIAEEPVTRSEDAATGTVSTDIAVLREIPVGDIHPNPRQPREVFDEEHMEELVTSIQEVGILQPVVVREVEGASTPYELIMGERRWRATQRAGLETIPAIVRQTPDQDLLRDALLENLHRSQLNPLEEAAAYQQLMEDFSCTQEELSRRIGRSRPQISNTMRLLRLPPLVQRRVAAGTLSAGHARALLGLTDPAEMERLAQRIVTEGLSVRATEDAVAQLQGAVRPAPKATRTRSDDARHERLDYFATALTSRLDTQVRITLGARKGRIAIDFTSVEDLNRIMDLIQGDQSGTRATQGD